MTFVREEPGDLDATAHDHASLPLVSVVVTNFNYATLLDATVASILAQTYPKVEIILVDDCSVDDSVGVMRALEATNDAITVVALTENVGQSAASLRGFERSSGPYVIFLDSDDLMLSRCVEAHVWAHLSSRLPVAFTSVAVINNVAGQDVNISHEGFSKFVASGMGRLPQYVQGVQKSLPDSWFAHRPPCVDEDQIHFVLPPHADPWVWSPTSANCYRRDAVAILLRDPGMETLRLATDTYLARPLSALFGSILVDRPLVRYVMHGANNFLLVAPLQHLLFFDPALEKPHAAAATRFALKRLVSAVASRELRYDNASLFFDALLAIVDSWPGPGPDDNSLQSYLLELRANRNGLCEMFDAGSVDAAIKKIASRK